MSQNRTLVFIAIGALALAGAAFATIPATAEEEIGLEVTVDVTSTSPRLAGVVTVTLDGAPVAGAVAELTSTHDALPLPAASTTAATAPSGQANFDFGLVSTASVPGSHTLTVVVTYGDLSETVTLSYDA